MITKIYIADKVPCYVSGHLKGELFMALAFIAPGQGAQFIGMGLELSKVISSVPSCL